jgi:hypothetical protein
LNSADYPRCKRGDHSLQSRPPKLNYPVRAVGIEPTPYAICWWRTHSCVPRRHSCRRAVLRQSAGHGTHEYVRHHAARIGGSHPVEHWPSARRTLYTLMLLSKSSGPASTAGVTLPCKNQKGPIGKSDRAFKCLRKCNPCLWITFQHAIIRRGGVSSEMDCLYHAVL